MTAGVIAQIRFVELFFENSGVNDDQSGEFGNYSRLRDVAESVTDENSSDNVHMEMVTPGQLRCTSFVWSENQASQRDICFY